MICNGIDGEIIIADNTFEEGATLGFNGSLSTGWNPKSVDLSNATFESNVFEKGSSVVLKYDETDPINDTIKNLDVSKIADNLGTPVKDEAFNASLNKVVGSQFTYTAK